MRIPQSPPHKASLPARIDPDRIEQILDLRTPTVHGKYLHWDELRRRTPPGNLSHEEWWMGLTLQRSLSRKSIPMQDKTGGQFHFTFADPLPEHLHRIDSEARGTISTSDVVVNEENRDRYYISSLMEEAITSSQIEGAATTRLEAKEMIRRGKTPRNKSQQMILNNYQTMQFIGEIKEQPMSLELIFDIHRRVTEHTLESDEHAGQYRSNADKIVVWDQDRDEVLHRPPPAGEIDERMQRLCDFANGKTPEYFVHPVIRAIAIHFWLAYIHPFVDGNGRTARALFYWSMLHQKYWLFEYVSISTVILKGRTKYAKAFLYTETDNNDLTYFIIYHLEVIQRAIKSLHDYIDRKSKEIKQVERKLQGRGGLNHRQRALLSHALRHPGHEYTTSSHQRSHGIVPQTARTDLMTLVDKGLLIQTQAGRRFYFQPAPELETRLEQLR